MFYLGKHCAKQKTAGQNVYENASEKLSSSLSASSDISIVVPAFNASATIEDCLDHVFRSDFHPFETIVVDDGSTDDTLAKARRFSCQILQTERNRGAAHARNRGADRANAELILFIDSDVLIPSDLLSRVRTFFDHHPDVSILQGCYDHKPYYRNLLSQYKHYIFSFRGLEPGDTHINYVHTACAAVRKDVFQKIRFDETLKRREDIEFGLRASQRGYKIFSDQTLIVRHKKLYDLISYTRYQVAAAYEVVFQQAAGRNKNFTQEFRSGKQPFYKKAWTLRPLLSLAVIVCFMFIGRLGNLFWLCFLGGMLALSIVLELPFRLYLARRAPIFVSAAACFLYFYDGLLIGLGAGWGLTQALVGTGKR